MDYSETLGKLSLICEDDPGAQFSISRVLSLPLDILASLVRNRREAELLLQVSTCASSLDRLTETYEMIALRAQGLQGAWDGLWLSKDPFVVPAIPIIGTEMSGTNKGRCMLLEKMDTEIRRLQELEKQLSHHIDVNYSLVEELQMEGIDKLAVNKLLLVEVEKELVKRITCICNNESMRGFSSMRQFVLDLRRTPPSICMTSEAADTKDPVDSVTNDSCSTEKVTPDEFSQPRNHADLLSPGSQSFASKCIALTTQGENGILSLKARSVDLSASQRTSEFQESPLGLSLSSSKGTSSSDGKPDVRNQPSSASEERLPKVSSAIQIFNEPSPITSRKLLMDMAEELAHRDNHEGEVMAHHDNDGGKVMTHHDNDGGKVMAHHDNDGGKVMAHHDNDGVEDMAYHDDENAEIMHTSPTLNVELSNGDLQMQIEIRQAINSEFLLKTSTEQRSFEFELHESVEKQIISQPFQSAKLDLSRKRPFESIGLNESIVGEMLEVPSRDPKRLLLQTVPDGDKAIYPVEMPSFGRWEMTNHNHIANCEAPSENANEQTAELGRTTSKSEASLTSCSCDPENIDNVFRTQGRCTDCGCLQPHVFKRYDTSLITWTPSCNPQDDFVAETTSYIQGEESPMLATQ